jgi:hypothetical protein
MTATPNVPRSNRESTAPGIVENRNRQADGQGQDESRASTTATFSTCARPGRLLSWLA